MEKTGQASLWPTPNAIRNNMTKQKRSKSALRGFECCAERWRLFEVFLDGRMTSIKLFTPFHVVHSSSINSTSFTMLPLILAGVGHIND